MSEETGPAIAENSDILLYGKGVFTTAFFQGPVPFLWEKHWRRLRQHAAQIGLDISAHAEASVADAAAAKIADSRLARGRVRITFRDQTRNPRWGGDGTPAASLSILVGGLDRGSSQINLTILRHRINSASPLAGIKSCNYLENLLSLKEARKRGADEAVRLNERGEVASACLANIFWSKQGRLFTPSLETGCLAGTTREFVLENLECEEVRAGPEHLNEADSMFLTSAGIGVRPAILDRRAPTQADHPIMRLLPYREPA